MDRKQYSAAILLFSTFFLLGCSPGQSQQPFLFPDEPSPVGGGTALVGQAFHYGEPLNTNEYGLPYDVVGLYTSRQLLVSRASSAAPGDEAFFFTINEPTNDDVISARVQAPGGLIYHKGYVYTKDGWTMMDYAPHAERSGRVKQVVRDGALADTNWISTAALADIPLDRENMVVGDSFIVAYVCFKPSPLKPWSCGCNTPGEEACARWTLQKFTMCPAGDEVKSDGACGLPEASAASPAAADGASAEPVPAAGTETDTAGAGDTAIPADTSDGGHALPVEDGTDAGAADVAPADAGTAGTGVDAGAADVAPDDAGGASPATEPAVDISVSACTESFMSASDVPPITQSECVASGSSTPRLGECRGSIAVSYGCTADADDMCAREATVDCAGISKECQNGVCVLPRRDSTDPCATVMCNSGDECRDGTCYKTCTAAADCPAGQQCRDGVCFATPCATNADCQAGQRCDTGLAIPQCVGDVRPETGGRFRVSSPEFIDGAKLPVLYTATTEFCSEAPERARNVNPPLTISNPPSGTASFVLVVSDRSITEPDGAVTRTGLLHWLVWDIPAAASSIPESSTLGTAFDLIGDGSKRYLGPCPPSGETHQYDFTIYALSTDTVATPALGAALDAAARTYFATGVEEALRPYMVGTARLTGEYY